VIGDILQPTHLLFVLIVALLVLGPKRLPEMARTLGSGMRDFKAAISGEDHDAASPSNVVGETAPSATAATTTYAPDAEYSAEPGYVHDTEPAYAYEPEPAPQPEPAYVHEPEATHRPEPAPRPGLSDEHESELTNIFGPPPEPSAQSTAAPQEPAAPAPEHHAPADAGSPEPTEVHAPAGSQPDSA
jgi:sec-independent protein translocase protein TatA